MVQSTSSGSIYDLDVVPGGRVGEGTVAQPVDVTGSLPWAGTVGTADSYYVVTGLSAGQSHTVRLTDLTDNVTLIVDGDSDFTDGDESVGGSPGTDDETATFLANAQGELYVRVFGGLTTEGATYTLDAVPGGWVNEGHELDPLDVTGMLPHDGQVGTGRSYYVLTGLTPGGVYTIGLTGVAADVGL